EELPSGALSMNRLIGQTKMEEYPAGYLKRFRPDPNDVALILPTSGTTGLPKGVPRTHNSYLAGIAMASIDTTPETILGLPTPIGHGLGQQGAGGSAIMMGATVVMIEVIRAREIMEAIQKHK